MARRQRRRERSSGGLRATAANAAGGVALAVVDEYVYNNESVGAVIGDGILKPIVNGAIGHLAKRYAPNVGAGMVGVAGFQLANVLFTSFSAPPNAEGLYDAGAVHRRRVPHRRDAGFYGETSFGRPELSQQHFAQPFDAGAIFDPAYA